jgi:hypothetical protein
MARFTKDSPRNPLRLFLFILIVFAIIDAAIRLATRTTGLLQDVVDIQTPATLYAKLNYFRGFEGRRIAFLGDSVVYGRRMEEAGDSNWRKHTIPSHVEALLQTAFPQQNFLAMNLAMNGALPADLEQAVRLISPLKPDCIVADISLRSFSADFAAETNRYSRNWLRNMQIDSSFDLHTNDPGWDLTGRVEARLRDLALSYWNLYRMRDFVQWRVFNSEPSEAVRRFRDWLDQRLSAKPPVVADPLDDMLLMIKAKNRHDSVTLADENPQVAALRRTLDRLAADKQCAVFFYATEEKKQLAQLMDPQRYQKLQSELKQIFTLYADRGITFIPPLDILKSEFYLDYGHLNDAGNAIVATVILEGELSQSIARSTGTQ